LLKFWELPESTEDVFSLFTPTDIRRARDSSLPNLETLLLAICSRMIVLRNHPSFPDPELAPDTDALNCIRILTRILPFIYEADHLEAWEEQFFWAPRKRRTRQAQVAAEILFDEANGENEEQPAQPKTDSREDVKPLAEELIDTLLDLLFYTDFTIPKLSTAEAKVSYAIWHSGVGCNTAMVATKEHESNRMEILRLLLTLTGKSMYTSPSQLLLLPGNYSRSHN
jgi:High-temperature-induced dauer-formation protein